MAEISVGLGPLNVKFDFSLSWWGKLKKFLLGPDSLEAVFLFLDQSSIYISKPDEGEIILYLSLVNASRKKIVVDKLLINFWQCSTTAMPDISPNVYGAGTTVERYKYSNITIIITLNSSMIRHILESATLASNLLSSPGIHIKANGQLFLKEAQRQIMFEVYSPNPNTHIFSDKYKYLPT
jgi:hypothetical protein